MPEFLRAYIDRAAPGKPGDPIRFVASTANVARDGLVIDQAGWQLENYRKNPVVLWAHDYGGFNSPRPPIGRADNVTVDGDKLMADIVFDKEDEFAAAIDRKYRNGILSAVSVGWDTLAVEPAKGEEPSRITKAELLDISAVPVPGDPDALKERQKRGLADYGRDLLNLIEPDGDPPQTRDTEHPDERGAIPPHTTGKAPEETAWDGPGELAKAEGKTQLRRMSAWVDDEGDPAVKRSYKLPHHEAQSGDVVWRGVAAAMARLLQSSTQIPDSDRRGVYNHLKRHYQQFDRTPPEFRTNAELAALGPDELRGLFLEGEPELVPAEFARADAQAGAALLAAQYDALEQALTLLTGVRDYAKRHHELEQARAEETAASTLLALLGGPE